MTDFRAPTNSSVHVASPYGRIRLEVTDRCLVRFEGEIDVALCRDLFQAVADAVSTAELPVQVDCSGVTFFGAHGLGMLALLKKAAVDGRLAELTTAPAVDLVLSVYPPGIYTRVS